MEATKKLSKYAKYIKPAPGEHGAKLPWELVRGLGYYKMSVVDAQFDLELSATTSQEFESWYDELHQRHEVPTGREFPVEWAKASLDVKIDGKAVTGKGFTRFMPTSDDIIADIIADVESFISQILADREAFLATEAAKKAEHRRRMIEARTTPPRGAGRVGTKFYGGRADYLHYENHSEQHLVVRWGYQAGPDTAEAIVCPAGLGLICRYHGDPTEFARYEVVPLGTVSPYRVTTWRGEFDQDGHPVFE